MVGVASQAAPGTLSLVSTVLLDSEGRTAVTLLNNYSGKAIWPSVIPGNSFRQLPLSL